MRSIHGPIFLRIPEIFISGSNFRVFFPVLPETVIWQPAKSAHPPKLEESGKVLLLDED
jgi:hypothetical protein